MHRRNALNAPSQGQASVSDNPSKALGAANVIGLVLFGTLFLVFLLQISARFIFNLPLPWTDEAAVILYVWVILWAAAFMVPAGEHVAFDLLTNLLPARGASAASAFGAVVIGALCAWALPATWDYVRFMAREGTPVLGLPFMAVFFPFVLLFVALIWRGLRGIQTLITLMRTPAVNPPALPTPPAPPAP